MKALIALGVVQTVLILFLIAKVASTGGSGFGAGPEQHAKNDTLFAASNSDKQIDAPYEGTSEERLRQIVREELAHYLAAADGNAGTSGAVAVSRPRDQQNDQYQKEYVDQQIEYFTSMGRISNKEMTDLQVEIAKLNETDRKQMLSKLIQALNAGKIDGKLL